MSGPLLHKPENATAHFWRWRWTWWLAVAVEGPGGKEWDGSIRELVRAAWKWHSRYPSRRVPLGPAVAVRWHIAWGEPSFRAELRRATGTVGQVLPGHRRHREWTNRASLHYLLGLPADYPQRVLFDPRLEHGLLGGFLVLDIRDGQAYVLRHGRGKGFYCRWEELPTEHAGGD